MLHPVWIIGLFWFLGTGTWAQSPEVPLKISHLTGDFYIYTTYQTYQGAKIPAHGMYVLTEEGVILLDTPWDSSQFQPLLDSISSRHQQEVKLILATHWHSDKTAGLEYYKEMGIPTYTTSLTDEWSQRNQHKRAEFLFAQDTVFRLGSYAFETFYPGEGHSADNIVLWFEQEKILYGGCLIKGAEAKNLGNMEHANVLEYYPTLLKVKEKYPNPNWIILSHSNWDNLKSLDHSIELAKKLREDHLK